MKLTALILDDEQDAALLLKDKLGRWLPEVEVLKLCTDTKDAMFSIVQHKPDILFLDIYMPEMNGLEFFRHLRSLHLPLQCIIVTAHSEPDYFKEAIRLGLTDYVLKPVIKEELQQAVQNAILRISTGAHLHYFHRLSNAVFNTKISLPIVNGALRIAVGDIIYAQASGKFTELHLTPHPRMETLCIGISEFEKSLPPDTLLRIDRFMIINTQFVQKTSVTFHKITFRVEDSLFDVAVSKTGAEKVFEYLKNS